MTDIQEEAPIAFQLQGKELAAYRKFLVHRCKARFNGKPNPSITISFTPTSIGTAVEISCHCGQGVNATDYDLW